MCDLAYGKAGFVWLPFIRSSAEFHSCLIQAVGVSPEKVCWCEYWDIWVPSHRVFLAVRWCAIFFGDNRSRSVLGATQMGCNDLIGRQWNPWTLCLFSSARQPGNRVKHAAHCHCQYFFFILFFFPINSSFIYNEIYFQWVLRDWDGEGDDLASAAASLAKWCTRLPRCWDAYCPLTDRKPCC